MTGSLSDRLLGDKIWETNPYVNSYRCRNTPRCDQKPNWKSESRNLRSLES